METKAYLKMDAVGEQYLYQNTDRCPNAPRYEVTMTETIDPAKLAAALNDVYARFPQMAVGIEERGNYIGYRDITTPAKVYPEEGQIITLGTEDSDGHLIYVTYAGKTIYCVIFHGLGDGLGFNIFVKALVFRYAQLMGYPVENDGSIRSVNEPFDPLEAEDQVEKYWNHSFGALKTMPQYSAFMVPLEEKGPDAGDTIVEIKIPFKELHGVAKAYQASPLTFLSPVFGAAIYEKYEDQLEPGKPIIAGTPINLRQFFPTPTTRYFAVTGGLAIGKAFDKKDFSEILKENKAILDAQMDGEYLLNEFLKTLRSSRSLLEADIPNAKKREIVYEAVTSFLDQYTYLLTNIGNVVMPDSLLTYVEDFNVVLPAGMTPFTIAVTSLKGIMTLNIAQYNKSTDICERFVEILNALDIGATITRVYSFHTMRQYP